MTEQGAVATPQQIAKVEAYRTRFTAWFPTATDGRGTADTTLAAPTCVLPDGGVRDGGVRDGGIKPPEDGGLGDGGLRDAGLGDDAGLDAGFTSDAGLGDAGSTVSDAGASDDGGVVGDAGLRRDGGTGARAASEGCGCQEPGRATSPSVAWLLLLATLLWRRRARRCVR